MKRMKLLLLLSLLNLAAIVTVTFWKLPEFVPIHANWEGVFDSFAPRWVVPLFGLVAPILAVCMMLYRKRTQSNQKAKKNRRVEDLLFTLLVLLFGGLAWLAVAMGLSEPNTVLPYPLIVGIPLGILMIIFSNYDGTLKQNRWFGIRTKWTLASEDVWRKTHRVSGYTGVIGGCCMIIGALVTHFTGHILFFIVGLFLSIVLVGIYPMIYSYFVYQQQCKH